MIKFLIAVALTIVMIPCQSTAQAPQDNWEFEITPYVWLPGIEGDITEGGREIGVDVGFEDLLDAVDLAGAALVVAQYNRWVFWGQFDYLALDTDKLDDAPDRARLETDVTLITAALGYKFDLIGENSTIDVLVGIRFTQLDNNLSLAELGSVESTNELYDGLLVLRPSLQISDRWRFNPTISVGSGDSELTYELQPQFQYKLNDLLALRFGYRRLYYDISDDRKEFEGSLHGLIIGLGFIF